MAKLRSLRRRLLPFFPSGSQTRAWKSRVLRQLGVARTHEPRLLVKRPELRISNLLRYFAGDHLGRHGQLSCMQIGAYDGIADDDFREVLTHDACRAILVEPQPAAFARLQAAYGSDSRIRLANVAVDRQSGTRDFYMPSSRLSVVSSFNRQHLIKHGIPAADIVVEKIPCRTIAQLLESAGWSRLDLLQIDAEGYDYQILKSIDFSQLQPSIIRFEFAHFSRRDLDACLEMLASRGYRFFSEVKDVMAIRVAEENEQATNASSRRRRAA